MRLNSWMPRLRDSGGLVFIDLSDCTGLVQVVFAPAISPELVKQASSLRDGLGRQGSEGGLGDGTAFFATVFHRV